jgi:hypothetical protein
LRPRSLRPATFADNNLLTFIRYLIPRQAKRRRMPLGGACRLCEPKSSEHDRGVFIFAGQDASSPGVWTAWSLRPTPADPKKTFRVLTLYALQDLLAER